MNRVTAEQRDCGRACQALLTLPPMAGQMLSQCESGVNHKVGFEASRQWGHQISNCAVGKDSLWPCCHRSLVVSCLIPLASRFAKRKLNTWPRCKTPYEHHLVDRGQKKSSWQRANEAMRRVQAADSEAISWATFCNGPSQNSHDFSRC
jgi:hypothetical protein